MKKKVVCYGDSNTYGFNPLDASRYDVSIRWTSVLQKLLGFDFEVIEEGANNRTGFVNNPAGENFSSQVYFPKAITKYNNADFLILAIGTNDLQFQYNISEIQMEIGLKNLILLAKKYCKHILIIPPVILNENIFNGYFINLFDKTSIEKSKDIWKMYENIALDLQCDFINLNNFVKPSKIDGLHYDENSHKIIAEIISKYILSFVEF